VEIIHVIVTMNSVPSYVLFHIEHVTYAIPISTPTMNHEILVSLKPITTRLVIPHVSIISTQTRFVQPTYVVWNTHTNEVKRFKDAPMIGCITIIISTKGYPQLVISSHNNVFVTW
jgi:hypothetical protein